MINRLSIFSAAFLGVTMGAAMGFGQQNESSFVQPADIADAIESNFSSVDRHLIRWSTEFRSTKVEKATYLQQASALQKLVDRFGDKLSEEKKSRFEDEVAVLKELAANHPKRTAYRCQLVVCGKNIQCFLGPVGDPESNENVKNQLFPDRLVDSAFLEEHWKGGLIYSLYEHPDKSMILRQLNSPMELRREVNQGKIYKMIYEFCGPLYLPGWSEDQFDMRWGLEQISTNLKTGSFVESLRSNEWRSRDLKDGRVQIERSVERDFFERLGAATPKKSPDEALKTVFLTRFTFSPDLLPISKVIYRSIVANGKPIRVELDDEIRNRLKAMKLESPEGFFPAQIVGLDYRELDGVSIIEKMEATSYGMLFRDSTDANVFPCEPRLAQSIYGAFDTIFLDHLPTTEFLIKESSSWIVRTEKFAVVESDLGSEDFEFGFGDTPIIERSSNAQANRDTPYRTDRVEPADTEQPVVSSSNFGPLLFLFLMVFGVIVVLLAKKMKR